MTRRPLLVCSIVALVLTAAPATAGPAPGPHIVDPAGDANGLPLGSTSPASYDAADILSVRFETTYVSVPVGADGIDHQETGIRIRIATQAPADSTAATISIRLIFTRGACNHELDVYFAGDVPDGNQTRDKEVEWWQTGEDCPVPGGLPAVNPAWRASTSGNETVIPLPYAGLSQPAREALAPGEVIPSARATSNLFEGSSATQTWIWFPILDSETEAGRDFVVGEDVPPDVPCTRDCP